VVGAGGICTWSGAIAAGTSWLTSVSEVTVELLGVPLAVVMAALGGALLARSTADPAIPIARASVVTIAWVGAGCASAPTALALTEQFGYKLPTSALAFLALLVGAFGPRLYPVLLDYAQTLLGRWLGKGKEVQDVAAPK
jgi:hypothetical protein